MEKDYTKYEGCASAVAVILALVLLAVVLCLISSKPHKPKEPSLWFVV